MEQKDKFTTKTGNAGTIFLSEAIIGATTYAISPVYTPAILFGGNLTLAIGFLTYAFCCSKKKEVK